MNFPQLYYKRIIQYDLLNNFLFINQKKISKIKKITLNFGYEKSNFKQLIAGLVALEFISFKRGKLTKSNQINITLKIKKGTPVGCKVVLRKNFMYLFYLKLLTSIFFRTKLSQGVALSQASQAVNSISFKIENPLLFSELENQYQFFKSLPPLDITITTNSTSKNELFFLLKSFKFPCVAR